MLNLLKVGASAETDPDFDPLLMRRTTCRLPVGDGAETRSSAIRSMSSPSVTAILSNSASLSAAI